MPIYRIDDHQITQIERTTFKNEGIREQKIQELIRTAISVIAPDTLIVAEEFGEWEGSKRRIDLLGIDKDANLIVVELKRTEHGGHMELQAIRYAAMISALTLNELITTYEKYLQVNNDERDATQILLDFLDWNELDEERFAREVKIVLVSAEFSKELTTSVMWLNESRLDIRCVRMQPYVTDGQIFIDVQTVIPIPEAVDYQVRIREKRQKEHESRQSKKDYTKYDVSVDGQQFFGQNKRHLMFCLVSSVLNNGGHPNKVVEAFYQSKKTPFRIFDGTLSANEVKKQFKQEDPGGAIPLEKRFFSEEDEPFQIDGKTYVLTNQWGTETEEAADSLARNFPERKIEFTRVM